MYKALRVSLTHMTPGFTWDTGGLAKGAETLFDYFVGKRSGICWKICCVVKFAGRKYDSFQFLLEIQLEILLENLLETN
jgi:hypothetical protein